jgi:hypothetical protein
MQRQGKWPSVPKWADSYPKEEQRRHKSQGNQALSQSKLSRSGNLVVGGSERRPPPEESAGTHGSLLEQIYVSNPAQRLCESY